MLQDMSRKKKVTACTPEFTVHRTVCHLHASTTQEEQTLPTIHIHYPYRTFQQSSPLRDQPSSKLWLFHATLQQIKNSCSSSSLLVTFLVWRGHGHLNWYQTVEFSHVYHHTNFKRNWFTGVPKQATVISKKGSLTWTVIMCTTLTY